MNLARRQAAERALIKITDAAELLRDDDSDRAIVVLLALSIAAADLRTVLGMTRTTTQMERFGALVAGGMTPELASDVLNTNGGE